MRLLVVGGGTAGLMTAIMVKNYHDITVDVVHSKTIGTVGVGEGATEHFRAFRDFVGISNQDIIRECNATYKCGILFDGWTDKPYLHSVGTILTEDRLREYSHVYGKLIADKDDWLTARYLWKSKATRWFLEENDPENVPFNQYHFDTLKLVDYLTRVAQSMGINVIEDDISDLYVNPSGNIEYVIGQKGNYEYDFFVDATGFKRLLISRLGAKWVSHGEYLKMNSAIVFQTPDTEEYNLWTYAKAMDNGWMFRSPVWGRHGNGYIYNSDYMDATQAKEEIERKLGYEVNVGKEFHFDAGHLDRAWINNCVAIGLSSSFIEPLEASSIGTTIQQAFLLNYRLINYNDQVIASYNKSFISIMNNIRDFIALHYMVNKDSTQMWRDLQDVPIPQTLKDNLEIWRYKLPITEDFAHESRYILFNDSNFISVMGGMGMFDNEAIGKEYRSLVRPLQEMAEASIEYRNMFDSSVPLVGHKELLESIRG